MSLTDLGRFKTACVYPGALDEQAVERELAAFLQVLGARRRIVRLRAGRPPQDDAPLNRDIEWILDGCVKRNFGRRAFLAPFRAARRLRATLHGDANFLRGRNARAALDARHASAAGAADAALTVLARRAGDYFRRPFFVGIAVVGQVAAMALILSLSPGLTGGLFLFFLLPPFLGWAAAEIVRRLVARARTLAADPARALRTNLHGSTWELSGTACALFDAVDRGKPEARLRPLFEAFVCGCWLIYWADDTLYWIAKPTVHRELGTQRLHHDAHAALESHIVSLYFCHGVIVPPFVIRRPDLITTTAIDQEQNAEVRRAMIERYRHGEEVHGAAAFIRDAGGRRLDHDERYGTLWRRVIRGDAERRTPGDEPIVMLEVVNRTPEPDGSFKRYWLRVPPTMRTAREAVAWTFNMRAEQYAPRIES
jgi:hypothetical protein